MERKSARHQRRTLNESPSEKEGKSWSARVHATKGEPSMKVPPKRKGNTKNNPRMVTV